MSLFSFSFHKNQDDLHRLKTAAKLGFNLFQIQMQIEEYTINHATLSDAARESHANGNMSENDLWIMYRRIKEAELQKMALAKSERIIRVTMTGLENQATMEKMRTVLEHTVHQHKMLQESGMNENSSERLMDVFNEVTQHITQGQSAMDQLDAQNDDISIDVEDSSMEIALDNNFNLWKQSLSTKNEWTVRAVSATEPLPQTEQPSVLLKTPQITNILEEQEA